MTMVSSPPLIEPAHPAAPAPRTAERSSAFWRRADVWKRVEFWASVLVVLTFSQCWVMPLIGPGSAPIDPAVSASIRNYYFPMYALVLGLAAANFWGVVGAVVGAPLLTLLTLMPFISMSWSIDPDVTMRRGVAVFFTTLAGVVIASRFKWAQFLTVLATAFTVVVVLCFVFALAIPSLGRMHVEFPGAWCGVWAHKNALGFNMSLGFMVFMAAAAADRPRRWLWVAGSVGAVVLVIMSQSKTSFVSLLAGGVCVAIILLARRGPVSAVIATFVGGTALLALVFTIYVDGELLLNLLGKDSTLTGRTKIWAAVMHQIEKRPITGYGYGAVWDDPSLWGPLARISKEQGFVIHEAHNSWLGVWLELGYIGLLVWALLFFALWVRTIFAIYHRDVAFLALPFLAVFSLHTLTEAEVLAQNDWLWMMFAAVAVKLATRMDDAPPMARAAISA